MLNRKRTSKEPRRTFRGTLSAVKAVIKPFREKPTETGDENEKGGPTLGNHQAMNDPLGKEIARILCKRPEFKRPLHFDSEPRSFEPFDSRPTLRPLISSRNWCWIRRQFREGATLLLSQRHVLRDLPDTVNTLFKFIFWNTKSVLSGLTALFGLCLLCVAGGALASTFATIWTVRFTWLVSMTALALLIDFKDVSQMLPARFHNIVNGLVSGVMWFDAIVLQRRRYQGREWGESDFDFVDGKHASSFAAKYLWDLPPPLASDESTAERRKQRVEWSQDTTQHIEAIDFCVLMLREASTREKYEKIRKFVFFKRNKTNSLETERNEKKEENFEAYDFARSSSSPAAITLDDSVTPRVRAFTDDSEVVIDQLNGVDTSALDGISTDSDDISLYSVGGHSAVERSYCSKDSGSYLNWMDVGAEIGKKLLGSAAVQKAMTSHDTAERIVTMRENLEERIGALKRIDQAGKDDNLTGEAGLRDKAAMILPPVHSMWTSASAAAHVAPGLSPTVESSTVETTSRNVQIIAQCDLEDLQPSQKPFVLNPRSTFQPDHADSSTGLSDMRLQLIPPPGSVVRLSVAPRRLQQLNRSKWS